MTGALVLRPDPGNARTCAQLRAVGVDAQALPLFAVRPLAWTPPDPARFDALLLTSANALRHGGEGLGGLTSLPVIAVGDATAAAAREYGFTVAAVGTGDGDTALGQARAQGFTRFLHLAGRDHRPSGATTLPVYASEPIDLPPAALAIARSRVVLLHSARAATRFAALIAHDGIPRDMVAIAALSPAVASAAGPGWRWSAAAPVPTDAALVALVRERLTGSPRTRISTA